MSCGPVSAGLDGQRAGRSAQDSARDRPDLGVHSCPCRDALRGTDYKRSLRGGGPELGRSSVREAIIATSEEDT